MLLVIVLMSTTSSPTGTVMFLSTSHGERCIEAAVKAWTCKSFWGDVKSVLMSNVERWAVICQNSQSHVSNGVVGSSSICASYEYSPLVLIQTKAELGPTLCKKSALAPPCHVEASRSFHNTKNASPSSTSPQNNSQ